MLFLSLVFYDFSVPLVLLYCQPSNGHLCIWLQFSYWCHLKFAGSFSATKPPLLDWPQLSWGLPFRGCCCILVKSWQCYDQRLNVAFAADQRKAMMMMILRRRRSSGSRRWGRCRRGCWQMRRATKVQLTYIFDQRCCLSSAFQWRCEKHY